MADESPAQPDWTLLLFPEAASEIAPKVDMLGWALLGSSAVVVLGITLAVLVFCIRYRAGSPANRKTSASPRAQRWLEIGWTIPVLLAFMVFFIWSAMLYLGQFRAADPRRLAQTINVVAQQWMWKFQHPDGVREINELHVPVGREIRLRMTSQDVIHSFFVPAFRIKLDVLPGTYTELGFKATKTGRFHLFCAEFCGLDHSRMTGKVVVMQPAEFQEWLQRQPVSGTPAARGKRLFREYGCSGCHSDASTVGAPALEGLFGRPVPLADGTTVMADYQYLRDSILLPATQVPAGYPPVMPSFQGQISEADILDIIAYIQSLADTPAREDTPP